MITDKELRVLDIHGPKGVEVSVRPSTGMLGEYTLWVNVDGLCRLRIGGIIPGTLKIDAPEEP